jgi:hypothetical protein
MVGRWKRSGRWRTVEGATETGLAVPVEVWPLTSRVADSMRKTAHLHPICRRRGHVYILVKRSGLVSHVIRWLLGSSASALTA